MILSDRDILWRIQRKELSIHPNLTEDQVQPASIDVRLGHYFKRFRPVKGCIDVKDESVMDDLLIESRVTSGPVRIEPGEFMLASTLERISLPDDLVARVEGRSSIGRIGLTVHVTAGFIDPGFSGYITLEIANLNRYPIDIYPEMRIAQLAFQRTTSPSEVPYGHPLLNSKYQNQGASPEGSRVAQDEVDKSA